jgi:hypothetical protein
MTQCPCGSYDIQPTGNDFDGDTEYLCLDCGEYFIDRWNYLPEEE